VNETEIVSGVLAIGWALLEYGVDSLGVTLLVTVSDSAAEVAALKWASPPYVAVIEFVPAHRLLTLSWVAPWRSGAPNPARYCRP